MYLPPHKKSRNSDDYGEQIGEITEPTREYSIDFEDTHFI
jgi:hypothetical protein